MFTSGFVRMSLTFLPRILCPGRPATWELSHGALGIHRLKQPNTYLALSQFLEVASTSCCPGFL